MFHKDMFKNSKVGGGGHKKQGDLVSLLLLYSFSEYENWSKGMNEINPTVAHTERCHSREFWKM
jgi:hypothetical protein